MFKNFDQERLVNPPFSWVFIGPVSRGFLSVPLWFMFLSVPLWFMFCLDLVLTLGFYDLVIALDGVLTIYY